MPKQKKKMCLYTVSYSVVIILGNNNQSSFTLKIDRQVFLAMAGAAFVISWQANAGQNTTVKTDTLAMMVVM